MNDKEGEKSVSQVELLQFPAKPCLGNVQQGAVLGDGATGHFVALCGKAVHQFVVGEGVVLVLVVHHITENFLDFAGAHLLAFAVFEAFGEEILERENAEVGLDPLAVYHAGNGGNVKSGERMADNQLAASGIDFTCCEGTVK